MAMTEERAAERNTGRTGQGGRRRAGHDREAVRARRDHEARVAREARPRHDPDGLDRARPGARRRRHPARPDHRDLRPGVVGQDDGLPARPGRGPGARRGRRLHRCRARARSGLRPRLRRQRRRAPRQPARHRRAGARDHRDAHPLGRHRLRRRRLGRRARAAGRDRRRDGRQLHGRPGPADEPGAAQADRRRLALEHRARLHQPAAREDRGHVRQPGDDARAAAR